MKCLVCKHGETRPGPTTVTLERGATTVVFKGVPALICDNCGEEYLADDVTRTLLTRAEEAVQEGVQVDVRQYLAA